MSFVVKFDFLNMSDLPDLSHVTFFLIENDKYPMHLDEQLLGDLCHVFAEFQSRDTVVPWFGFAKLLNHHRVLYVK